MCAGPEGRGICYIAWGMNCLDASGVRSRLAGPQNDLDLDEVIYRGFKSRVTAGPVDLPADLAFLDIEESLPKLSVLPAGGRE